MAQSVELLLDEQAESTIRHQWELLADAGLARPPPASVRPHITLFAADDLSPEREPALSGVLGSLDLEVCIGALMIFGPRRGRVILVRQVTPSLALLCLQTRVAEICGAEAAGQFGPGRWSPHVTLARRILVDRIGDALTALGPTADRPLLTKVSGCRRWDGVNRTAWLL